MLRGATALKILGVDEAGRGPVIGPMVICGVLARAEAVKNLVELGVRDSKELTPHRRVELKAKIVEVAEATHLIDVSPREIDGAVRYKRLNRLEAEKMAEIIEKLNPDVVYVDAPSINPKSFQTLLQRFLKTNVKIVAENYADKRYPIVSAASILAKTRRDEIVEGYRAVYGDFGSGYPSDGVTIKFLETHYRMHGSFPDIVRLQWETGKEILKRIQQRSLTRFTETK